MKYSKHRFFSDEKRSAIITDDERYRYNLQRVWNSKLPLCIFNMLNPSTADHTKDDPTIRRCIGFASRWGCGGILIVNLFAYRATKVSDLKKAKCSIVGPQNRTYIQEAAIIAEEDQRHGLNVPYVCAWGPNGALGGQAETVLSWIDEIGPKTSCLGLTKDKYPRHPLMVPYSAELQPYNVRGWRQHV